MIATCPRPELEGLHLAELARRTGREPAEALMDLVLEEKAGVSMVCFSQSERERRPPRLRYAHAMIGSDSLVAHAGPGPHRRQAAPAELRDVPARARATTCASGGSSRWRPRSTR